MTEVSSKEVKVELVTPEELLFVGGADMVVIPGVEGDFGVLAGHAPFLSMIRPGVIQLYIGNNIQKLFVAGGFAEVTNSGCTILAEEAYTLADIHITEIDARMHQAKRHFEKAHNDIERLAAEKEIAIAEAMSEAIKQVA